MIQDQVEARYGPVIAVVNSRSLPEKAYSVRSKDGVISCNCKGWIFNKEVPRRCRHVDAVVCSSRDALPLDDRIPYTDQSVRRKAERRRRAGVGVKKDAAVIIVEKILAVGDCVVSPGTLACMAGALRPYLQLDGLRVQPSAEVCVREASMLVAVPVRCITLED